MGRVIRSYIEHKLQNGRFIITEEIKCFGSTRDKLHKPHWSDCRGIFGEIEMRIKILIPTKNCIAKSVGANYKAQQVAGKERFDNTLTVLADLNKNGSHKNIATLVAFQRTEMPLFYAIRADGATNFLKFLLLRRERKHWCSFQELVQNIKDAISAVSYLHSKRVIHRDITACSFDIVPEQSTLKLSDFRLAMKLDRPTETLCLGKSLLSFSHSLN